MEDHQPEFTPTITEDRTPGSVVIFSPRLVEGLKARRDAEESATKPEDHGPNTAHIISLPGTIAATTQHRTQSAARR